MRILVTLRKSRRESTMSSYNNLQYNSHTNADFIQLLYSVLILIIQSLNNYVILCQDFTLHIIHSAFLNSGETVKNARVLHVVQNLH